MEIAEKLKIFKEELQKFNCKLIAVSKTYPIEVIMEAYKSGQKAFGENKVQELVAKHEDLPKDIEWHLIGHLQTNKVKYISSFVHLIHSVDSLKLLQEINKQAAKQNNIISCLLQIFICNEETKFGLSYLEAEELLSSSEFDKLNNIKIKGFMGMATNTEDHKQIRKEFHELKSFFEKAKKQFNKNNINITELSMGMSGDYKIALEEGSTMIRVGSAIFGQRSYKF